MHPMSALFTLSINRTACAACLCVIFLLTFWSCTAHTDTFYPTHDTPMDILYPAHYVARTKAIVVQSSDASYHHTIRISASDLKSRQDLERSIQLAAFEQFGSRKTGSFYNVSVTGLQSGTAQAIRLRSGSLRRYGVTINEFIIPRECEVNPTPERVLLLYTRLTNSSFFQNLPEGHVLASPVLSVLVYDAMNLSDTQPPQQIGVSTTSTPITIQFPASGGDLRCASFDVSSTNVNYTNLVEGACQVTHLGVFALVSNVSVSAPSPSATSIEISPQFPRSRSNTWKIVVGSVVGGLGLLALIGLLALGIAKHRKKTKFAKMEYQTDHGETLQTTTIGKSRVPAAGGTRTQSMIEREYSV